MKLDQNNYARFIGIIPTGICFCVYMSTVSTGLSSGDAGELALVQLTLGIPHPTGYPIFVLLGFIWSKIPLSIPSIYQLNILSTIYSSCSCWFLFRSLSLISRNYNFYHGTTSSIINSCVAITIALGSTIWYQSTGTEVYSLHILILNITIFYLFKCYFIKAPKHIYWIAVALMVGLGMSNHLTFLLLIPGLLYLFFVKNGFEQRTWYLLLKNAFVVAGTCLLSYGLLILLAHFDPILNWGNPYNFSRLFEHVTATAYRNHAFTSWEASQANFIYFLTYLPNEYIYPSILFIFVGGYSLYQNDITFFKFILIGIIINIGLVINYNIPDLHAYYLLTYLMLGFLLQAGIAFVYKNFTADSFRNAFKYSLIILPVLTLSLNYSRVDQHTNHTLNDFVIEQLNSVDHNAIVLTTDYDLFISGSMYYQHGESIRRDVTVIDLLALLEFDWYIDYLEHTDPTMVQLLRDQLRSYHNIAFAKTNKSDIKERQDRFSVLIHDLIKIFGDKRPIYFSTLVYSDYLGPNGFIPISNRYQIVPQRFLYRVVTDQNYYPLEYIQGIKVRSNDIDDRYTKDLQRLGQPSWATSHGFDFIGSNIRYRMALMIDHRIQYELRHGDRNMAKKLKQQLVSDYPAFVPSKLVGDL